MSQVLASHILIKYDGSRRPASFRDPNGDRIKNTTLEQAKAAMTQYRSDITSGKYSFEDVAYSISDCSSAQNGGSLGHFSRGEMQKSFEDVAFSLEVGEISDLVVSDSGVHIIKRYE